MSSAVCTQCGCSEIERDSARGDAVCTHCGSVLEDQIIVSEVQFQETGMGSSSVMGQYVSQDGPKSFSLGTGFHHGMGKESRQVTLQNGKGRIQRLGAQLKLNQHCIDTAFNFFKMAVNSRLTRGRRTSHVVAACLYIVCRTEATPHPCLYIDRFAHKLEFGDKTYDVSMTALRMVQRMKRDWMSQGRRPSGLCGAALLVAARIYDFNRSIKDIIKVVKIGEGTIRKRLAELEATPSSQLTIDEFQKIDLEEEMDPPCFTEGKKKARLQLLEEQGQLPHLTQEISKLQEELEEALEEVKSKKLCRFKKFMEKEEDVSTPAQSDQEGEGDDENSKIKTFLTQETLQGILIDSELTNDQLEKLSTTVVGHGVQDDEDTEDEEMGTVAIKAAVCLNNTANKTGPHDNKEDVLQSLRGPRPTVASLGLNDSIENCMKINPKIESHEEGNGELDLTGIDDSEIDKHILNSEEVKIKTLMWTKANAEYLQEQRKKQEQEQKDREEGNFKSEKKKKRPARKKNPKTEAQTAGEAIEKILQEKKISSKINYDVLKDLKKVTSNPAPPVVSAGTVISGQVARSKALRLAHVDVKPTVSGRAAEHRLKRSSTMILKSEPGEKKPKIEKKDTAKEPDVIVESGPVNYDEDEDEEEEEEEEEDEHVSARALMGHADADDYDVDIDD